VLVLMLHLSASMNSLTPTCPPFSLVMELFGSKTFAGLIKPAELAHVQMTATVSKSSLGSQAWSQCLASCLTCIPQSLILSDEATQRDLLHLYGPLSRSIVAVGEHQLVQNAEEAARLGKLLHRMEKARSTHLHKGGHVAYILVGRFRVSPSNGAQLMADNMSVGPRQTFALPPELSQHLGGCSDFLLQLGPTQDSLLLRIGLQHATGRQTNDARQTLVLDVGTACTHLILNYKGAALKADHHSCHATVGMHAFPSDSMGLDRDSFPEVLCAFFVRDGSHHLRNSILAQTLNLDRIRQH